MRRMFSRRNRRGRSERVFVPPSQREEVPITTAEQMVRSWSLRTTRLVLSSRDFGEAFAGGGFPDRPGSIAARSLTAEVAHRHPGTAAEAYLSNLRELFERETVADVTLRAGPTEVRAHRCIVAARCAGLRDVLSEAPGSDIVDVSGTPLGQHPEFLRQLVARCYGVEKAEAEDAESTSALAKDQANENIPWEGSLGPDFSVSTDLESISRDLFKVSDTNYEDMKLYKAAPPDVAIVGRMNGSSSGDVDKEWRVEAHAAILCAHSEYVRSFLTHGWKVPGARVDDQSSDGLKTIHLDASHFAVDAVEELVLACYSANLYVCNQPIETILQLLDGASYLGMDAVSLLCEEALAGRITAENLPEMLRYGTEAGAKLLPLDCHKFICRNLSALEEAGTLPRLTFEQMQDMLQSEFVESPEEDILGVVLRWSAQSEDVSESMVMDLVAKVRIPMVPVDAPALAEAQKKGLVSEEQLRVCRLFQTDSDFRRSMIDSGEPIYRLRMGKSQESTVREHRLQLELQEDLARRQDFHRRDFPVVFRMLGTINGRNNFDKIETVKLSKLSDSCDGLECNFPGSAAEAPAPVNIRLSFADLDTHHRPTAQDREEVFVNKEVLQSMTVEGAERLTAKMLRREEELRLHNRVQMAYGVIGEDEEEMSRFTTALQAYVATEFNVDTAVGIELIRSASTLFPETAKIAHYVRHNRCFKGDLKVGDTAPDVPLSTLDGGKTTLWSEIDKRRSASEKTHPGATQNNPVVIVGASYT